MKSTLYLKEFSPHIFALNCLIYIRKERHTGDSWESLQTWPRPCFCQNWGWSSSLEKSLSQKRRIFRIMRGLMWITHHGLIAAELTHPTKKGTNRGALRGKRWCGAEPISPMQFHSKIIPRKRWKHSNANQEWSSEGLRWNQFNFLNQNHQSRFDGLVITQYCELEDFTAIHIPLNYAVQELLLRFTMSCWFVEGFFLHLRGLNSSWGHKRRL